MLRILNLWSEVLHQVWFAIYESHVDGQKIVNRNEISNCNQL